MTPVVHQASGSQSISRAQPPFALLCGIVALLSAGLLVYSQTYAFAADEGFHLLAAQLIAHGKRPYLDFFFPQTPLNAFWNALWMRVFGESWRVTHMVAGTLVSAAILMTADYVFVRMPAAKWRLGAAIVAAFLAATNLTVVQFGAIGQACGWGLFLIVGAFRAAVIAVNRKIPLLAALAGFLAGAAAGSSLLTAPVAPVLLLWILVQNQAGKRIAKAGAFIAGSAIALAPLLWLFAIAPWVVKFNVLDFHLLYRQVEWSGAIKHDLFEVLLAWTTSTQALLLGVFAAAGVLFVRFRSHWGQPRRAEMYLCAWLALALGAHLSNAHPTFPRYYLLMVPFLSILGAVGLYSMAERLYMPERPLWPVLMVLILLSAALGKSFYDARDDRKWSEIEQIAARVEQVSPRNSGLLAMESIYFLTRRPPPSGMEASDSHKLNLPAAQSARLHILPRSEVDRQIQAGLFSTVQTCAEDEELAKAPWASRFIHRETVQECALFWQLKP